MSLTSTDVLGADEIQRLLEVFSTRVDWEIVAREYLRVSYDRSGEGASPNEQHDEHVEICDERDWGLHPDPYVDLGSASPYATNRLGRHRRVAYGTQSVPVTKSRLRLMRTCSDCGEEAQGPDQPCAACGSTRQTVAIYAQGAVAATGVATGISVKYAQTRPWYEQWHAVRQQLASAEGSLHNYRGNDLVKREFENFFTKCYHLLDWIAEDPSTGLTIDQVRAFVRNEPSLRICRGMANTTKHHTLKKPTRYNRADRKHLFWRAWRKRNHRLVGQHQHWNGRRARSRKKMLSSLERLLDCHGAPIADLASRPS